jgi:two-component system NtrC family sensor kinase
MIKKKTDTGKITRVTNELSRNPVTPGQLKMLQKQLVQAEKMASLGQLAAGVAHDIKNSLNLVVSFVDLSLKGVKEIQNEFQTEKNILTREKIKTIEDLLRFLEQNLQKIKEHGNRIDGIVKDMLLHSRGEKGEFQPVDLNRLLEENISLLYHSMRALDRSFDIKIETSLDHTIGKVKIVPQEFSRAFLNIANNACFAANEKRKKAAPGFFPSVSIKSRNLGENIEICIRDNGNGIPRENRNKLFTPFFTTKPAGTGTGLGLSIAHEIITKEHKGAIDFKSKEGEYAEFIITIPA